MKPIEIEEICSDSNPETICGFIAIVGRPNVGKSSLLNSILGKKVSITSFRPQTTRYQVLGIKTQDNIQTVYVDTPGIHLGAKKALNRQMNKIAHQALIDVNAVVFMVEALKWTDEDEHICKTLKNTQCPLIVALNKIDLVPDKGALLSFIEKISQLLPTAQIMPLSVKKQIQVNELENLCRSYLPASPFYFPEDQIINHSEQFHISEIVREKLMRLLEKEIPYATSVQVETLEHKKHLIHVNALIWVEREGQKRVVIGEKGSKLREIGIKAREDLERYYGKKVCLKLWVKVNESWSDNMHALHSLGYVAS
ncbi:MAG: GTPase Era [Gammaproteobacteria bacterium 39-13]|nr:GTPase Era [Gammaproteobacteria bacterium]OJV85335.1 MAG: GTPase Era [Gammaproteobacteria bacterium 39-13]